MTSTNEILTLLQTWIEDESIDSSFLAFINHAVREAEEMVDWASLYGQETITVESDGILTIPAEAHKILAIYSSSQIGGLPRHEFHMRDDEPSAETGGYIMYTASPYPAVESTMGTATATITQGGATITSSAAFDSSWEGKRLLIGSNSDLYKISTVTDDSNITLSQPVPFASGDYTVYVEPLGTERFLLQDRSENIWSGDVEVRYQKKHPTLVQETDRLLIPCPRTVALLAFQDALITDKYTVDSQRLNDALILAKSEECGKAPFGTKKNSFRDRTFSVRSNRRRY